ncbi:hypothetical protein [Chondromyces crocatus]|nr:hypothetical protein [Chondromyces crocatus]
MQKPKLKLLVTYFSIAGAIHTTTTPAHTQTVARCTLDDALGTVSAVGRNAWARKCGHISASAEAFFNSEHLYVVYQNACSSYPNVPLGSSCAKHAPTVESAPCVAGLSYVGTCIAGCYTPTQELSFEGRPIPIEEAHAEGLSTVSALTRESNIEALTFAEQPIRAFVSGETIERIFLLEALDGRRLEVTSEHPMVDWRGDIVRANTLSAGDRLLGADGTLITLNSVSTFPYSGLVWNVMPSSHDKRENIVNASGFLSGSVRFQNEWAAEAYRLAVRDALDVSSL